MTDVPPEDRLAVLLAAEPYWIARAMQEQGSAFYQKLGEALDRADVLNRRRVYETWTEAIWDFYRRGLELEARES